MLPNRSKLLPAAAWIALAAISFLPAAALAAPAGEPGTEPPADGAKPPRRGWQDLRMPPLRQFSPPKPERTVLQNGLVLYLLEDHELPTIDLVVLVRTGSVYETRDKAGLAEICGEVMRTGGTASKTGDELDATLEDMAASVEVGIGTSDGKASLSCLKESFEATLPILMDVLEHPAFRVEKLELAKKHARSAIARRNDQPEAIARREYARAIYGDDSPYGWTTEVATIDAIARDDLVAFHKRFFGFGDRTIVGVVGDFETAVMRKKIEDAFGGWPKATGPLPPVAAAGDGPAPKVYLARKTDIDQTTAVLGHMGIRRTPDNPDYAAIIVANDILGGGGFASRLLQRVRTEMGLAYSVWSYFNAPYSYKGTFSMTCQTKSGTTLQAITAMKEELERLVSAPVTEEELRVSKDSILQRLIFASETRAEVIERALRYEYNDFPQDYLERFQAAVAGVTADDCLRAARKYLHPKDLTTLVVGNDKEFDGSLATLGEVQELDVNKPAWPRPQAAATSGEGAAGETAAGEAGTAAAPVAPPAAAPTEEALEKGRALIAAAVKAKGGLEALESVRSIRVEGKGTLATPQGPIPVEMRHLVVFPDRARVDMTLPIGTITRAVDGERGWIKAPQGVMDLPESQVKQLREQVEKDELLLLVALSKPEAKAAFAGTEKTGEGELDIVDAGPGTRLFFDKDGRLVRRSEPSPEGVVTSIWSDFRDVEGISFPFSSRMELGGEEMFALTATAVEVNGKVPGDAFTRPAGDEMRPGGRRARPPRPQGTGAGN